MEFNSCANISKYCLRQYVSNFDHYAKAGEIPWEKGKIWQFQAKPFSYRYKVDFEETQSQNITAVMPRAKTGILCIHKNHVKAFTSLIAS